MKHQVTVLIAAAATAAASPSAGPPDHLELIRQTPCLLEYREWFFTFRRPEVFPQPPEYTREQCEEAKRLHERIQLEQHESLQRAAERSAAKSAAAQRAKSAAQAARASLPAPQLGMTPEEVLASRWGRPTRINRTTTARGSREQWVYGSRSYLYFENGRLTAIQSTTD